MSAVAVVEDHLLLAETLTAALATQGIAATVVAPAAPADLVRALLELRPRLVLLDLDLGTVGDSMPAIGPLTDAGLRVLVVSGTTDRERMGLAYEAGAWGFVAKSTGFDDLLGQVAAATRDDARPDIQHRAELLAELLTTRARRDRSLAPFRSLTERERHTLEALSEGRTVGRIADDWTVSEATVRSHVRAVLGKLGAPNQLAAVTRALRCGWISTAGQSRSVPTSRA